jgi:hypothetical protein
MRCDAMRCDAMRCDAMRCGGMRCDAMRCDAMRCDGDGMVLYSVCSRGSDTKRAAGVHGNVQVPCRRPEAGADRGLRAPVWLSPRLRSCSQQGLCGGSLSQAISLTMSSRAQTHTHTLSLSCVSGCAHGVVRVSAQARERYAAAARDAPRKRSMKEGSATGLLKNQRSRSGDPVRWLWQRVAELCRLVSMCRVLAVLRGAECGGTRSLRALGVVAPPHSQCSVVGCVRSSGGLWRCKRRLHCASLVVLCRSEAAAPRRRRHGLWRQRLGADDPCGFCGGSCHV